ncbi:DUF485 domain-containing protein [soil metagenome]
MSQLSRREIPSEDYERVQTSAEFVNLRKRFRGFAFTMTVAFLVWYLLYVLMSAYAVDFMSTPVLGNINVGLIFGLLQFVSTFVITTMYVRHANKNTDPIADELREQLEGVRRDA